MEGRGVALTSRAYAEESQRKPAASWTVLFLDDLTDGIVPVLDALGLGTSRADELGRGDR